MTVHELQQMDVRAPRARMPSPARLTAGAVCQGFRLTPALLQLQRGKTWEVHMRTGRPFQRVNVHRNCPDDT